MRLGFRRFALLLALAALLAAVLTAGAFAWGAPSPGCNSGRGNGSEGDSSQLIDPSTGNVGTSPTVDCDPGMSGPVNAGGD